MSNRQQHQRVSGPFWCYFGGKWRIAPTYPKPLHRTIIEPFAGAAGYSLRYAHHDVILVDKYPVICEVWRWLIGSSPADVRAIPCVESVDDLPSWVPEGARHLVGFSLCAAGEKPRRRLSTWGRAPGRADVGWNDWKRERVARNVPLIKHWTVVEGEYADAPDVEATWFVDPPYAEKGKRYVHGSAKIDFSHLGEWCKSRRGQVIACENYGATWLPFSHHRDACASNQARSLEVVWYREAS